MIGEICPKQRRNRDTKENETTAHRGRTAFFEVRLRAVIANDLTDLFGHEFSDESGVQCPHEQRRNNRHHESEGHVSEDIERCKILSQIIEIKKH